MLMEHAKPYGGGYIVKEATKMRYNSKSLDIKKIY